MDREECDYYKPISKKDRICDSYTGDRNKQNQISNCRYHCSTMEFKKMMEEGDTYKRVRGAIRKKE